VSEPRPLRVLVCRRAAAAALVEAAGWCSRAAPPRRPPGPIMPPGGSAVRWGGEAEELLAWCLRTRDRAAFAAALGSVPEEEWDGLSARLKERLGAAGRRFPLPATKWRLVWREWLARRAEY
jgi:hypothetical protein